MRTLFFSLPFAECKNDGDGFKKCKDDSDICIWDGLFHDKIINCPFNDCLDEGGCPVISSGMSLWFYCAGCFNIFREYLDVWKLEALCCPKDSFHIIFC